jgi:hypothetical protein
MRRSPRSAITSTSSHALDLPVAVLRTIIGDEFPDAVPYGASRPIRITRMHAVNEVIRDRPSQLCYFVGLNPNSTEGGKPRISPG